MNNHDICLIVVLFNPSQDQIETFGRINNYDVIVVDNSDHENKVSGLTYIPLFRNTGIAFAQNKGIQYAKNKHYKYILFFDQDSKVDDHYISDIFFEFNRITAIDKTLKILGPLVIDEKNKTEYKSESNNNTSYNKVNTVISSGSIVSVDLFNKVGLLDESLFIDYVDCELCWRARSYGYSTYMTRNVALYHNVGSSYRSILGVPFGVSSPFRYFYQYRNMLWLMRRKYVPFSWKYKSFIRSILDLIVVPFISNDYTDTLKFMIKGYYAGIKKQIQPHF